MFIEEGPTSLIGTLANCDIHKYYDVKVGTKMMFSPEEDSDLILTVQNSLVGEIYKTSFPREQDKWEEYGYNYLYYKEKARELKREMGELWPEESSSPEKSMEKYLKKLDELEKCVKFLSENVETLPYNYAVIEFGPLEEKIIYTGGDFHLGQDRRWEYYKEITSYTHNRNVNYCDENGKKWGYSDGSLSSLILGEKIELSVSTFSLDTNFKTEKIIATVYYSDGSTKSSIITPSNYEELNLAPSGKHTLRWSDELGDYEFMITKE